MEGNERRNKRQNEKKRFKKKEGNGRQWEKRNYFSHLLVVIIEICLSLIQGNYYGIAMIILITSPAISGIYFFVNIIHLLIFICCNSLTEADD